LDADSAEQKKVSKQKREKKAKIKGGGHGVAAPKIPES
jgi:hypothetical protein